MKNIALFLISFTLCQVCLAQCPSLEFSYDIAGNRIVRQIGTSSPCRIQNPEPENSLNASLYPNPTQDRINIVLEKAADEKDDMQSQLYLYDMSGKEMYSLISPNLKMQMDITALSAGSYYLQVIRGDRKKIFTIMKY